MQTVFYRCSNVDGQVEHTKKEKEVAMMFRPMITRNNELAIDMQYAEKIVEIKIVACLSFET